MVTVAELAIVLPSFVDSGGDPPAVIALLADSVEGAMLMDLLPCGQNQSLLPHPYRSGLDWLRVMRVRKGGGRKTGKEMV